MRSSRPLAAITVLTAAFAAVAPSIASTGDSPPGAHAAKKKKKPLTATVNGTFTVREDDPAGFGNDEGPKWQQLEVTIKDAKVTFAAGNQQKAAADVMVHFEYLAEAHTADRSWAAGCDSEDRVTTRAWNVKTKLVVRETDWVLRRGTTKPFGGWRVVPTVPPEEIYNAATTGSYQEWESILMENCLSFDIDEPLGTWSTAFAQPEGVGKMTSDNKSVLLTSTNTHVDQTGTARGSIKFSKPVTG